MADLLSQALLIKLGTTALQSAGDYAKSSLKHAKPARELRKRLFGDDAHAHYSEVFQIAVQEASFAQLKPQDVEAFLSQGENIQVVARWMWEEPEMAQSTLSKLDFSVAARWQDKQNLHRFAERLPEALRAAFQEIFPGPSATIDALRRDQQREHAQTRDIVTGNADEQNEKLDQQTRQIESVQRDISRILANQEEPISERIEADLRSDLEEVGRLRVEGRLAEPGWSGAYRDRMARR